MVEGTSQIGIIVSYVLFISIMLFITPFFAPDLFNVTSTEIQGINQEVEAGIFEVVLGFINQVIIRFTVLLSISVSGTLVGSIIGIFVGAYTVGALVALILIIAEALP